MSKKIVISLLIVNYHSRKQILCCVEGLMSCAGSEKCEIIIANNDDQQISAPEKKELQRKAGNCPITVIDMPYNTGFSVANNAASEKASGSYLFFVNPDTDTFNIDFAKMHKHFNEESELSEVSGGLATRGCGIIAPCIRTSTGEVQAYSFGFSVTPWTIIMHNLHKVLDPSYAPSPNRILKNLRKKQGQITLEVDWVTGAAFMMKKSLFRELGGFDENFFLYYEDIDLCKRVRIRGYQILLDTGQSVAHMSGRSSTSHTTQKQHYFASQDYYIKKHYHVSAQRLLKILRVVVGKK